MSFDVHQLDTFVLVGSAVTLLAILAVRVSSRAGLPSLLIYLLMGVALGEAGFGIQFENAEVAHALGFLALAIILAEGGLTTSWREARPSMRLGVSLATVGVAVSVTVVALGAHYVLGLPVGARGAAGRGDLADRRGGGVLGAAGGAAAQAADRRARGGVRPQRRADGRPGDPGVDRRGRRARTASRSSGIIVYELVAGAAIGLAAGFGGAWVMRRAALPSSGLYPLAVLTFTFLGVRRGRRSLHGSGFAAVYVAALVLGNMELPHRAATRSFAEGVAWLAQIGLFVMLGLLLSPGRITLSTVGPGDRSPA